MSTAQRDTHDTRPNTQSVEARVRALQTTLLFERSLVPIGTGIAFALLAASFAWQHISHTVTATWFGLKLLTAALRLAVQLAYRRRERSAPTAPIERAYLCALALDGAVWGLIGTWLVRPDNPVSVTAALALLVGVSAVGSHVFSAHGRAYACFTLPILLPTALYHLLRSGEMNVIGAVAVLGYLAQSAMDVRRSMASMRELTRLRYENELIAEARAYALSLAEKSNDAKGRFLATMSHEMRTPLNGVLGALQLLERKRNGAEDAALLDLAEGSGRQLLRLIDDVLDFAELEADSLTLDDRPFDVRSVIDEALAFAMNTRPHKDVRANFDEGSLSAAWTMGDPSRCRQIVSNLVQNAKKFSAGGVVDVKLTEREGTFVVSVSDDGIGIEPEALERIFAPFEQVDASLGRKFEGAGLGLAISRALARAMEGDVICTRSTPGHGSTFELRLPKRPLPETFTIPRTSSPPQRDRAVTRVLLVDDNELNALLGRRILEELGIEPIIRMGGADAVSATFDTNPDLIFLDIQMPEVDGIEATRQIRERELKEGLRRTPIVALTAHAQSNDRTRFLALGMDEYIPKPYRLADIAAAVSRFVGPLPTKEQREARGARET